MLGGWKGLAFRTGLHPWAPHDRLPGAGAGSEILICGNKRILVQAFGVTTPDAMAAEARCCRCQLNPCSAGAEDRTVDYSIILSLGGSNKASQYAMAGAGEG